jgi:hypothetical protein
MGHLESALHCNALHPREKLNRSHLRIALEGKVIIDWGDRTEPIFVNESTDFEKKVLMHQKGLMSKFLENLTLF